MRSMVISNGMPSCGFWALATSALTFVVTITPRILAPGENGPSNFTPNQVPNSVESDSARQTRLSGACRRIFFSMRSVFISNLLVAYYQGQGQNATFGLRVLGGLDLLDFDLPGVDDQPDSGVDNPAQDA